MLLKDKTAVIYGGGGAIGSAVAKAFAAEGATVYITGRTASKLEEAAAVIKKEGGAVHTAVVDALDKDAVEEHLSSIVKNGDTIDISFNLISINDEHGKALCEMESDIFTLPILTAMRSHFITATAAARHMQQSGGGVILTLTANAAKSPAENTGGFGVAGAAIEALGRQLAAEAGRNGVRVVGLRSAGSPDAPGVDEAFEHHAKKMGITKEAFIQTFEEQTMLKRLPLVKEIADAAVWAASPKARAATAAIINLTCGEQAD